jgi:hypothetical protein
MWITVERLAEAIEAYNNNTDLVTEEDYEQMLEDCRQAEEAWRTKALELAKGIDWSAKATWTVWKSGTWKTDTSTTHVSAVVSSPLEPDEELTQLAEAYEKAKAIMLAERDRRWFKKAVRGGRTVKELRLEIEALEARLEDYTGKAISIKADVAEELGLI